MVGQVPMLVVNINSDYNKLLIRCMLAAGRAPGYSNCFGKMCVCVCVSMSFCLREQRVLCQQQPAYICEMKAL